MKLTGILFLLSALFLCSCSSQEETHQETTTVTTLFFGDSITETDAVPSAGLLAQMNGRDSLNVKLSGKITDVCQKKGCWMEMEIGDGKTMRVSFKDYAFFVPKDASGKTAVIDGYAKIDTISVSDLKHYAEDAGKSKEEIEKITEPEVEITYEASGVIIKDEPK
ncbi:MAG: DUF4920 domain-containing protein [Bacteroidia bacterium]|nr:DUF4920 domain-containing protein [Bacteroidia bacterium]